MRALYVLYLFPVHYFTENMYRKGARRWRKLYRMNGHLFQAKRFSKVILKAYKSSYTQASYRLLWMWLYGTVVSLIFIGINFLGLVESLMSVDFLFLRFDTNNISCYICHLLCTEFHGLMVHTKTTKNGIQRENMNSQ